MLALGIVTVAILALVSVFVSGVKMAAQARDIAAANELARQVLERTRFNVRKGGLASIPSGSYTFDGRIPDPQVGAAPLEFPPIPYPGRTANKQRYSIVVSGSEVTPGRLKAIRVEVRWGATGQVALETHLHP